MTFGEKLYALRQQAGYSQEELAERLDVTRQAVSRWEGGAVLPDAPNLLQLGRLFDVSIDYLLKEELTEAHPASPAEKTAHPPQPPQSPAGDAPPAEEAPPQAGFAPRRPSFRLADGLLFLCLAMEAVGWILSRDPWNSRIAVDAYLFLNVLGVLLFEGSAFLLLAAPEKRAAHRLRFYRIAVWFLAWFPLNLVMGLVWGYYPRPHPSFAEPISLLAAYLFLCGGISAAAWHRGAP